MALKGRQRSDIICEYGLQVQVVFGDKPTHRYGMYEYAHITHPYSHTCTCDAWLMIDEAQDGLIV